MVPKGGPRRIIVGVKINPGDDFGSSRAGSKAKKLHFHMSVVKIRRSAFLRPRPSEVDFGNKFGTNTNIKINKKPDKTSKKIGKRKKSPKRVPKVATAIIEVTNAGPRGPSGKTSSRQLPKQQLFI